MSKQIGKILFVEDDETLGFVTKENLEMKGYQIKHCKDGAEGLNCFKSEEFDLCIFDVMLPKMDGFSLAEKVRTINQQIPILFLSAKSLKEDRIRGLKLGADDYITKPFSIEELILKVDIFLKRRSIETFGDLQFITIGALKFDHRNMLITLPDNSSQKLTQKESDLFKLFIEHKNNILKRQEILERLWGEDDYFMGRSLDVFISRLRKILKKDDSLKIENIHGVGFKLREL
jgi:DNA-binding response OmpR family regulator